MTVQKFRIRLVPLIFCLLIMGAVQAAPSFTCTKARTEVERTICQPENYELQVADTKLAKQYSALRKTLPKVQADWLRSSQNDWLLWRDECGGSSVCLLARYRERHDELSQRIISRPIRADKLPIQITLPGLEGEFISRTHKKTVTTEGELQEIKLQELFYSKAGSEQLLWRRKSRADVGEVEETLQLLTVILLDGDRVILDVKSIQEEHTGGYQPPYRWQHAYYTFSDKMNFVLQNPNSEESEEWIYPHYRNRWREMPDGVQLQVTDRMYGGEDNRYLNNAYRYHRFHFYFDGRTANILTPEPRVWLDESDAAGRFTTLYNEITAELSANGQENHNIKSCVNEEIDFVAAAHGLRQWLDIILSAQAQGVEYSQASAIVALMLAAKIRPAISNEQRELLLALDYYRKRIEETPDWRRRLTELHAKGLPLADGDVPLFEFMVANDFPRIELPCVQNSSVPKYERISFNYWLYSFWVRRQADGTYNLAKQVIEHLARHNA